MILCYRRTDCHDQSEDWSRNDVEIWRCVRVLIDR